MLIQHNTGAVNPMATQTNQQLQYGVDRTKPATTPQVVYVQTEKPAETPWLLILAVAVLAYYMGQRK